jgi:hypothetical protein
MLSTELEYLCTELECFLEGWNAFDRVEIPLHRVEMLSRGLECFLEGWNAFGRVGIPLYRVGMISTGLEYFCTGLECIRQSWSTFVQSWNAF